MHQTGNPYNKTCYIIALIHLGTITMQVKSIHDILEILLDCLLSPTATTKEK